MGATILLTGFGPFPGAPFNPTGPLVRVLARRGRVRPQVARRIAHVFTTSYQAVDRELPALIARERPDALVMFGLAPGTRHIRIETRARNVLAKLPDASGSVPGAEVIVTGGAKSMPLRAPAARLLAAARAAGMHAALSADAGSYLCNYLCWRASEAAARAGGPWLVTFVHVPEVRQGVRRRTRPGRRRAGSRVPRTLADLLAAGEAIIEAARTAPRVRR